VSRAALMRPKSAFVALGAIALGSALPVLGLVAVTGVYPLLTLLVHSLLFGTMALKYAYNSPTTAEFIEGELKVDANGIALDGRTIARRAELTQGFVVPIEDGVLVRLERDAVRPALFLRMKDEAEARRVLEALGFDATHVTATMRIASGLVAMPVGRQAVLMLLPIFFFLSIALGATALLGAAGMSYFFTSIMLLLAYAFTMAFAPTTVSIGTDGLVTRWLGRTRYIAFSEVRDVERYDEYIATKRQRGVRLTLRSGEVVRLATGQTDVGLTEAARLAARIEEARAARAAGAAHPADLLVRGDRTPLDWVLALRRLGAGAFDLRTPAIPHDTLLGVVEDSAAPAIDRASAAVAAMASDDLEVHRRVRVAAATTASPKLRVALELIADKREDERASEISAVLDELDEDAETPEKHGATARRR
jgi:hypothetical protein